MTEAVQDIIFTVAFMVILLAFTLTLLVVFGSSPFDRDEWQEEIYIVKKGDSLWEIAGRYCPEDVDRREWIHEVEDLNEMESSKIYPGQRLIVLAPKEG